MAMTEGRKLQARLEHRSPGRIRVRVDKRQRTEEDLARAQKHLESHSAVAQVDVNPRSGSILVQGESTASMHAALEEVLELVELVRRGEAAEVGVDAAVEAVKRIDAKLAEVTAGRMSLRWLVPAAFISVGVRQLLVEGLTLGAVPWYVLLYYGVDSFLKLYPEMAPKAEPRLHVVKEGQ